MTPEDPNFNWTRLFLYSSFASLGGVMGYVMRIIDKKEKINHYRASMEGISAGFVGLLFLLMCEAMRLPQEWTGVIVGLSGWLGANASIRILEAVVFKKLGLTKDGEPPDTPDVESTKGYSDGKPTV